MEKHLELLRKLLAIAGNISLSEAVTWLETQENAERLIEEAEKAKKQSE